MTNYPRNQKNSSSKSNRSSKSSSSSNPNSGSMMSQFGGTVKEHPFAAAAAAAGTVAAGAFLWSKRNQINDQASRLGHGMSDKMPSMGSDKSSSRELAMTEGPNESSAIEASRATARSTSHGGRLGSAGHPTGGSGSATTGQSATAGQNMNAGRSSTSGVSY